MTHLINFVCIFKNFFFRLLAFCNVSRLCKQTYQLKSFFTYLQDTYNCMCNTTRSLDYSETVIYNKLRNLIVLFETFK